MKPKKNERGLIDSEKIGAVVPADRSFAAPFYDQYKDYGWMQCTQCGSGLQIHKSEVDAGDYVDRQACDHCGVGLMIIDWTWPDGEGWKAQEHPKLCPECGSETEGTWVECGDKHISYVKCTSCSWPTSFPSATGG